MVNKQKIWGENQPPSNHLAAGRQIKEKANLAEVVQKVLTPPQAEKRKRRTLNRTTPTRSSPPEIRLHKAAVPAGLSLRRIKNRRAL